MSGRVTRIANSELNLGQGFMLGIFESYDSVATPTIQAMGAVQLSALLGAIGGSVSSYWNSSMGMLTTGLVEGCHGRLCLYTNCCHIL